MKLRKDFYIFIALLFILLAFSEIITGNIYYFRDFSAYVFPLKYFLRSEILRGHFPFLNPYSNLDVPFFANPQAGVLYPFSIILYILPIMPGLKAYIILHFLIAFFAMYYFLRQALHVHKTVALYAGLALVLSGFFLSLVEYLSILSTLAPFPFALAFIKKAVDQKKVRYWIFTGLIFSLQFLGGKPDHMALCMGLSYLFAVYLSFCGRREYRKTTLWFLASALIFLSLCMAQILPFLEFFTGSTRWMGTFEIITKGSVHPFETLKFVIPDIFGNYIFDVKHFWFGQIYFLSFYIGIAPLLLASFSLYGKGSHRSQARFFAVLFFAALILSFGRFTPLYGLLFKYFPFIKFMQYPSKFMYFAVFSLVVLSAIGLNNYLMLIRGRKFDIVKTHIRKLSIASIVFLCVLLFAFAFQGYVKRFFVYTFMLHTDFMDFEFNYIFVRLLQLCAILFIFTIPLEIYLKRRATAAQFASFIAVFAAFNLLCYSFDINPVRKNDFFLEKPRISGYLEGENGARVLFLDDQERSIFLFRNYSPGYPAWEAYHVIHKELMYPNINLIYGFSSPDSMWVLEPKPGINDSLDIENINMMALFNVKYIYTVKDIVNDAYELIGEEDYDEFLYPVKIYRNNKMLPKVFFTSGFRAVEDDLSISEIIGRSDFDPTQEVLLNSYPKESFLTQAQKGAAHYKINASRIDSNTTEVDVETEDSGFLFISRRYSYNWKCLVNEEPASVYRANLFFQAVPLRKGKNIVRLSYSPRTFFYGAAVSAVSLILLGAYLLSGVKRR